MRLRGYYAHLPGAECSPGASRGAGRCGGAPPKGDVDYEVRERVQGRHSGGSTLTK